MTMDILVAQSLEQAIELTGKGKEDKETQAVAFKLACAAMAIEASL